MTGPSRSAAATSAAPDAPSGAAVPSGEAAAERAIAARIRRAGLTAPALLWLDSSRPLSFVGGQALRLGEPLWSVFASPARLLELADVLEDRDRLDRLLRLLDDDEADA